MSESEYNRVAVVENGRQISIFIKANKCKKEVEISSNDSVKKLRRLVAEKYEASIDQICMIYDGKILNSSKTIADHGIEDGHVVRLVIKTATMPSPDGKAGAGGSVTPEQIDASPFGLGQLGGLAGLSDLGLGSTSYLSLQQTMQQQLMSNPDLMRDMMDGPLARHIYENPDLLRQLVTSSPSMQEIIKSNPEITQVLDHSDLMEKTMEVVRNPQMLQELMKSQNSTIPSCFAMGGQGTLPTIKRPSSPNSISPEAKKLDTKKSKKRKSKSSEPSSPTKPTETFGLYNAASTHSLLLQIGQSPQLMANMLRAPYMKDMMKSFTDNPDLMKDIVAANPIFRDNPTSLDKFNQYLPEMLTQMQTSAVQEMMVNPKALQALSNIQNGVQQLYSEAPTVFSGMTGLSAPVNTTSTPQTSPSTTASSPTNAHEDLTNMVTNVVCLSQRQTDSSDEKYTQQMKLLKMMGFEDQAANLDALVASCGDVNASIQ